MSRIRLGRVTLNLIGGVGVWRITDDDRARERVDDTEKNRIA